MSGLVAVSNLHKLFNVLHGNVSPYNNYTCLNWRESRGAGYALELPNIKDGTPI